MFYRECVQLPCGCDGIVEFNSDRASDYSNNPHKTTWCVDTIATERCSECGILLDEEQLRDILERQFGSEY